MTTLTEETSTEIFDFETNDVLDTMTSESEIFDDIESLEIPDSNDTITSTETSHIEIHSSEILKILLKSEKLSIQLLDVNFAIIKDTIADINKSEVDLHNKSGSENFIKNDTLNGQNLETELELDVDSLESLEIPENLDFENNDNESGHTLNIDEIDEVELNSLEELDIHNPEISEPLDVDIDLSILDELEVDLNVSEENPSKKEIHETSTNQVQEIESTQSIPSLSKKQLIHVLSNIERESIEEDILAEPSAVIVEKIQDIKTKLIKYWKHSKQRQKKRHYHDAAGNSYYSTRKVVNFEVSPKKRKIPSTGFSEIEKKSIEEDITSDNVVVIEENIKDIHNELIKMWDTYTSQFDDISDHVVVFKNENEVDNFIQSFETEKQKDDIKKLMSYLETIVTELPEDVLKQFVESEYYDIFSNLLNQVNYKK
jgi:hypothetical protein